MSGDTGHEGAAGEGVVDAGAGDAISAGAGSVGAVRVLLVDDQAVVRAGLATILSAHDDLEVVGEASDGIEAVAAVRRLDPDVVLMDVRMPRMDGIEATRAVVASGSRARICMLTTYGLDEFVYDAMRAGACGFLLKTDPPERIVEGIRLVSRGEPVLSASTMGQVLTRFAAGVRPHPDAGTVLEGLTVRERDVYRLVARGLSNREIAEELVLGEGTVKSHVAHVLTKLDLRDRIQIVIHARDHGVA